MVNQLSLNYSFLSNYLLISQFFIDFHLDILLSLTPVLFQYDKNRTKRMEFKEFLDMMANVFQYHLSHPEVGCENSMFRYGRMFFEIGMSWHSGLCCMIRALCSMIRALCSMIRSLLHDQISVAWSDLCCMIRSVLHVQVCTCVPWYLFW